MEVTSGWEIIVLGESSLLSTQLFAVKKKKALTSARLNREINESRSWAFLGETEGWSINVNELRTSDWDCANCLDQIPNRIQNHGRQPGNNFQENLELELGPNHLQKLLKCTLGSSIRKHIESKENGKPGQLTLLTVHAYPHHLHIIYHHLMQTFGIQQVLYLLCILHPAIPRPAIA